MKFEYVPVLLGGIFKATNNMSPSELLRGIRNKPEYHALETSASFAAITSQNSRTNPFFPVNTLMLMRGAVAAQVREYVRSVFPCRLSSYVGGAEKDGRPRRLPRAFVSSGIDIDRLIARAQQDDVKKKLIENTTDAVDRGAFGSPTFFVGTEMFFGKDQLRDVEKSIVEQTASLWSTSPDSERSRLYGQSPEPP